MDKYDLTKGDISPKIIKLALPIMGSSLIQMSYSVMDMFWLGQLSENSLSAAGAVSNLIWVSLSFVVLFRIGAEVGVGQSFGRQDQKAIRAYTWLPLFLSGISALIIASGYALFSEYLLRIFSFEHQQVFVLAKQYLLIMCLGLFFLFVNPVVAAVFHGGGNSKLPFLINTTGVIVNMVLDPLFIFGLNLGIQGAAVATVCANMLVFVLFIFFRKYDKRLFHWIGTLKESLAYIKNIVKWGVPTAIQNLTFSLISLVLARLINSFGNSAYAAYQVGLQVESIGWLCFSGFSTAMSSFIAQNYGAEQYHRLHLGYQKGRKIIAITGLVIGAFLFLGSSFFMKAFIPGASQAIVCGTLYLKVVAVSQLFSAWESVATGSFQGLGQTKVSSKISIFGNFMRLPLAFILSKYYGVTGIWMSIATSMAIKGILGKIIIERRLREYNESF